MEMITKAISAQCNRGVPATGTVTVDAVYTWVDGNCANYQALCRQYARSDHDLDPERFRDLYGMLKYSLRSLERYAPWVRNVYLVTCRPQVPAWIRRDSPRLRVVHHDEIFEHPEYLPTFNSNVIESYLHCVPSDATYLLYLNDDYLFGRDASLDDFVSPEGRINVYGTFFGEAIESRIYKRGCIKSTGFLEHNPLLIDRSIWAEMIASRPEELHRTRLQRFRSPADLWPDKWYRYFLLKQRRVRTRAVPAHSAMRRTRLHKITNDLEAQTRALDRLTRKPPLFFCMNDDQGQEPDREVIALVRDFFDAQYPYASSFER